MDTRTTPDTSTGSTQASNPAAGGLVDVEAILREVEALAGIVATQARAEAAADEVGQATGGRADPASAGPSVEPSPKIASGLEPTNTVVPPALSTSTTSPTATTPSVGVGSTQNLDVAALEREIESLLRGTSIDVPVTDKVVRQDVGPNDVPPSEASPTTSPSPTQIDAAPSVVDNDNHGVDVRVSALTAPSVDPMLRELEEILDDSNDAVLRRAGDSIDRALDTVFDPRALSGQEEEVNRALIEAFGTSRRTSTGFGATPAVVTNPVPRFEGISRSVPPELTSTTTGPATTAPETPAAAPRTFEEIAASSIARPTNTEYAGETPFEPAFPSVPPLSVNVGAVSSNSGVPAARTENLGTPTETPMPMQSMPTQSMPTQSMPTHASTASPASASTTTSSATTSSTTTSSTTIDSATAAVVATSHARRFAIGALVRRVGGMLISAALLPLRLLAMPMRVVPASAHSYVGIAAISMTLWVPVAWWMAQHSASAPGIGRIEFPVATSEGNSTEDASTESANDEAHGASSEGKASEHAPSETSHEAPHH
ncbi:MAG: hypothetical protein ACKO3W_01130 [bacterium]